MSSSSSAETGEVNGVHVVARWVDEGNPTDEGQENKSAPQTRKPSSKKGGAKSLLTKALLSSR